MYSDSTVTTAGKVNSDNTNLSDSLTFTNTFARALSDNITATDDINGEAVIDDDQTVQFIKTLLDNYNISDSNILQPNKVETDQLSSTDQVTILNQGYADNPNYFLEDYVGDSRILT